MSSCDPSAASPVLSTTCVSVDRRKLRTISGGENSSSNNNSKRWMAHESSIGGRTSNRATLDLLCIVDLLLDDGKSITAA